MKFLAFQDLLLSYTIAGSEPSRSLNIQICPIPAVYGICVFFCIDILRLTVEQINYDSMIGSGI
jgi:hypothetical protein